MIWEDKDEGEPWNVEWKKESEENSPDWDEELAETIAEDVSDHDFWVLQLWAMDHDIFEISRMLDRKITDVVQSTEAISEVLLKHYGELGHKQQLNVLQQLSECGHRTACLKCCYPLCIDHTFCKCGKKNPHFDLRVFKLLRGISYSQARKEECNAGHPEARRTPRSGHCHLCGTDLEPITAKRPE